MRRLIIRIKETVALAKYFFSFKRRARLEELTKRYIHLTGKENAHLEWLQAMTENDLIHMSLMSDSGLKLLARAFGTRLSQAGVDSLKEVINIERENARQYNSTVN
jgi:hypothetical protein